MNLFKKVTGYLWGEQNQKELIQLTGSFYDHYKNNWHCLFNDCSVTVLRSNRQFIYELVIDRKTEEGEEVDEDEPNEYVFSLLEGMELTKDKGPANVGFSWTNDGKRYLFELDERQGNLNNMIDLFELTTAQCLYEAKYHASSNDVPAEELSEFIKSSPSKQLGTPVSTAATPSKLYPQLSAPSPYTPYKPTTTPSSTAATPADTSSPFPTATPAFASSPYTTPTKSATPQQSSVQTPKTPSPQTPSSNSVPTPQQTKPTAPPPAAQTIEGDTEFELPSVSLHLFDDNTKFFVEQEPLVEVKINFTGDDERFRYTMYIIKRGHLLFAQDISNDMFPHFSSKQQSIIWVYSLNGRVWTWSIRIHDAEAFEEFQHEFSRCLLEVNSNTRAKPKSEETDFLLSALRDDVEDDVNKSYSEPNISKDVDDLNFAGLDISDQIEEEEDQEEEGEEEEEEEEDAEEDEDDEKFDDEDGSRGARNSSLAVGTKSNRTYVARGSQIGVFRVTDDDKLKYTNKIKRVKNAKGQLFSPKKLMLHDQDSTMLMLNPNDNRKLFHMDLNRDDIVEEWKVSEYQGINELIPQTKYAQTTPAKTFVGMNDVGFFLLDPRLKGDKMVDSNSYFYSARNKPALSCAATTGLGQMVVGSRKGEIRMFDQKVFGEGRKTKADTYEDRKPRAKTNLPGFGDPIVAVDVTEDGTWILATCKTYLLVIPTTMDNGQTGFEKPMGKQKPVPRRLQLKREDIVRMGGKVSFTPAHFNTTNPDDPSAPPERSIVTSSGPYVITWNFRKVKNNVLDEYLIKEYNQNVVADQFKFGEDKSIIVTLPDNVLMAKKVARKVA